MIITTFYLLLIAVCVFMELSEKVNTNNILNKVGLGFIIVGSLIKIYAQTDFIEHENHLVCIGVFLHFICEIQFYEKIKQAKKLVLER